MRKFINRNIHFDKETRLRFLRRLNILFDNGIRSRDILSYILEKSDEGPVKKLATSAMKRQTRGEPWAMDWAQDGYFTEEEALKLSVSQTEGGEAGFKEALQQLIADDGEKMGFWPGVLQGKYHYLLLAGLVAIMIVVITQTQRKKIEKPFETLGGGSEHLFLLQFGDFLVTIFPLLILLMFLISIAYGKVRQKIQTIEERDRWKKFGFFTIYDRIFEYKVISTIAGFSSLGQNTQTTLDSLTKIYKTPYERYRIGEVKSQVNVQSKRLIEALDTNITSETTTQLLELAAPDDNADMLAKACLLTKGELKEDLKKTYRQFSIIPLFLVGLMLMLYMFGMMQINLAIQQATDEAETRILQKSKK